MIIGIALITLSWTLSMPLWASVIMTVIGAIVIEMCSVVFTARFFKVASGK